MPTYLVHGFRWPRPLVRIHIILQNLDDAAAEWLMAPQTQTTMVNNFKQLHGPLVQHLPELRFIEQYDPADTSTKSQPYAYVCDIVKEITLSVDVDDIRGKGVPNEQWGSMVELRDKIAPGEKVGWWVVVCGDLERWAPPTMGLLEGGSPISTNGTGMTPTAGSSIMSGNGSRSGTRSRSDSNSVENGYKPGGQSPRSFRKWFGSRRNIMKSQPRVSLNAMDKDLPPQPSSDTAPTSNAPPNLPALPTMPAEHQPQQYQPRPGEPIPGTAV